MRLEADSTITTLGYDVTLGIHSFGQFGCLLVLAAEAEVEQKYHHTDGDQQNHQDDDVYLGFQEYLGN
jgi:hypothetical protein